MESWNRPLLPSTDWRSVNARIRFVLLVACSVPVGAYAADASYSRSDAERYIKQSEAAWAESVGTHDASVVKRILADDVIWVLDGKVITKTQAVAGASQGADNFLSDHLEYANVRFFGDVAVVQGSENWIQKDGKKGRFVWTDTWLRRNGQWQIVAAEDVSVPVN